MNCLQIQYISGACYGGKPRRRKDRICKKRGISIDFKLGDNEVEIGPLYSCDQYDFPLKVLSWFPKALDEFQRPPADGGLHAGAMISQDQNVDGEMLAVGSTARGYNITNWSRDAQGIKASPDFYRSVTFGMSYGMLNDRGLLRFWKELGDKYEAGEL